ncbi:thiolase family protein [Aeromicrobium sp.]|uniref:thiolase family protein n=1 Tax=Aeromicrobium sp. TaxID=1871063 RepID=UPI002FCA9370
MRDAVIVDVVRTPLGKRNGSLRDWHPVDLAAHVLKALETRNGLDPALVDDVIMGCVMQVGEQALNIGRNAVLAAGWPESVPSTTVDRQCGSSQQAVHFAAQGVMSGAYDIVVAAGVESMTRVPMGASIDNSFNQDAFSPAQHARYADRGGLVSQGIGAEMISEKWGLSRTDLDTYAVESHRRAAEAIAEGRFENEIVPVPVKDEAGNEVLFAVDEGVREGSTVEKLAGLKPAFIPDGKVTAASSSQISDGAAAVLIMSAEKAEELGLKPRARFHTFAVAGDDPVKMLTGPIPATHKVLERSGLTMADIDVTEINEAFASVVLSWAEELKPDMDKVNINGGAIAIGHPLGCSGARLTTTLLNALEQTGGKYGLITMCEGGGMANATIIETL